MRPVSVQVLGPARRELLQFFNHYEHVRPGLGVSLAKDFFKRLDLVALFPEMDAVGYRGLRRFKLKKYPILVYFRFESETVTVAALIHAARDQREALQGR